jgi:hypothetical protein
MSDCNATARTEGESKLPSAAVRILEDVWQQTAEIKWTRKEYGRKVGNRYNYEWDKGKGGRHLFEREGKANRGE